MSIERHYLEVGPCVIFHQPAELKVFMLNSPAYVIRWLWSAEFCKLFCWFITAGITLDTALASRPGVSPHAAASATAVAVPKEMAKDAVIPMHSISATLYVKGLTYQHILSVDMFTKEQVCETQIIITVFYFILNIYCSLLCNSTSMTVHFSALHFPAWRFRHSHLKGETILSRLEIAGEVVVIGRPCYDVYRVSLCVVFHHVAALQRNGCSCHYETFMIGQQCYWDHAQVAALHHLFLNTVGQLLYPTSPMTLIDLSWNHTQVITGEKLLLWATESAFL